MAFRGGPGGGRGGGRGKSHRPSPYGRERPWRSGGNWRGREEERGAVLPGVLTGGPELGEPKEGEVNPQPKEANDAEGVSGSGEGPKEGQQERPGPKKFSNRARLFFGNLPRDFTETELKNMLSAHGEVHEIYHNREKNFAFARMAYRSEAERVIVHHNGQTIRGRDIKVRFAASSCSVKVSNLNPTVSNELLAQAFTAFGEVEEAIVATDDRGKPLGYGIVDFARKGQAQSAIQQCRNEPFLLTKSPVPVVVTEMVRDNEDGLPEKQLPKNNIYHFEREAPPRFPTPGSLEYDVALRWKAYFEQERAEKEELEQRLKQMKSGIQQEMDTIKEQHQTLMLRQEIARHQQEQLRLAERLRKQEERLQGLQAAQGGAGILPLFGQMPAPLFPSIGGNLPTEGVEVPTSQPTEHGAALASGTEFSIPMHPPPIPTSAPLFMTPPPLMGQKPR